MKKLFILGSVVAVMGLTACDDFLNDNRYPLSQQTANKEFWSSETNVEGQINNLYNDYTGYGNGTGYGGFGMSTLTDDQCGRTSFTNWTYTNKTASSTYWTAPYIQIRLANLIIEGVSDGSLNGTSAGNDFIAKARLHRARNYFLLVKRYGDVPLVTKVLNPTDEAELYGPRTPRNQVMDFVLEDLNFAVENISTTKSATTFSSDLANAIKAEICLFEGTFAKYIENDASRANTYLQAAVTAGEAIAAKYPVTGDANAYWAIYNTLNTSLQSNPEIIFCKQYNQGVLMHSTMDYTNATDGIAGITKDAFDSYLFLDGKPKALTSMDTSDQGVLGKNADGLWEINIQNLLDVRDQRLSIATYPYVFFPQMTWSASNAPNLAACTGYGIKKYNNFAVAASDVQTANKNYTSCPLFWGARLYLAIAEAKAELGTLSDQDVTNYIAPLWARAGIQVVPTLSYLQNMNDPANNMGVSSLIWEIRRCRRSELMMDDDIRYWDLLRWKQLELLDTEKHPDITVGANISAWLGQEATDGSGANEYRNVNGYVLSWSGLERTLGAAASGSPYGLPREYFYPVPNDQIGLNPNLTQNPGWD